MTARVATVHARIPYTPVATFDTRGKCASGASAIRSTGDQLRVARTSSRGAFQADYVFDVPGGCHIHKGGADTVTPRLKGAWCEKLPSFYTDSMTNNVVLLQANGDRENGRDRLRLQRESALTPRYA